MYSLCFSKASWAKALVKASETFLVPAHLTRLKLYMTVSNQVTEEVGSVIDRGIGLSINIG
jgi:hypothetical protein